MKEPELPKNEADRLRSLTATGLLDTPPEERFDRLTRIAQRVFGVKIALVSLVDRNRQWFKSRQGLTVQETSRDVSFCAHAILQQNLFVVDDTLDDDRFFDNPLVTDDPCIRFYAGAPLVSPDGFSLGTLCIIDDLPRTLSPEQKMLLRDLAECVEEEIRHGQRERYYRSLERLSLLHNESRGNPTEYLRDGLRLGCEYLKLPYGIISHIQGEDYRVVVQVSPPGTLEDEQTFDLRDTYCALTLEAEQVLAIDHMAESAYASHPCYRKFGLESYIGIPLNVGGRRYGTLNFSSPDTRRPSGFSDFDHEFLLLLASWVSSLLERWEVESVLQRYRQVEQAVARAQESFINRPQHPQAFSELLGEVLRFTESAYGFIGEILHDDDGRPYMKTNTITNIAWDDASHQFYEDNVSEGLEFRNLDTLFGAVITSGQPVLNNRLEGDPKGSGVPNGHPPIQSFLGLPIHHGSELVGMMGLANRPSGYHDTLVNDLGPLLRTVGQLMEATRNQRQQRAAEEDLKRSEARLRGLFELSPVGIALNELDSGRFLEVNDAYLASSGFSRDELLALDARDVTPQEFTAEDKVQREILVSKGQYGPYEKELIRKDGSRYSVIIHGLLVGDASGRRLIWSIIEDITERKRLALMQREFVSTVSHELRTPLTAISAALIMVSKGVTGELSPQTDSMVRLALRNAGRLTELINDILDMEKLVAGKMTISLEECALLPLLRQVIEDNHTYAERFGVHCELDDQAPECWVAVDPKRLTQVVTNLLSNAVKFSPSDGVVRVTLSRDEGYVRVSVVDRGGGVPADFHSRLFRPFAQADSSDSRRVGGTGLGLAISKKLMDKMNGRIGYRDTEGGGATFYIDLPEVSENRAMTGGV
ncbi:GAF domain-containing protein [Marinobacter zhejiangensis]|uniref:histidine kinase n=1 Tax=Marinobacter zhejiangensis TaxID=488535 RepID=A0A1I4L8H1_9GAMM|nr:GAF domain-containing protein [Marinobacter zhejiangensis]SFL87335.1 PAS domain S-box-containing protein [Marinobacter zhejiangensis]